ncbi:hypothetical protein [Lentzea flaviverrucosa]|uniref:Uncharacterized protein n=1 Tax=Lentzea flaviverrucosa TaxID=200379 RepID=A0A1H9SFY8_9PSEU|nr:hypothetical protein [Lentzea flaviverrucosa]RDI25356.1 hypothetical protein DFR72_10848 [Lentzea flaviverrucosa]SER83871.1 hypothetical protein SAMN05216195_10749 [Lentzea flaviverrucosa]
MSSDTPLPDGTRTAGRTRVRDVVRDVVEEVARDELPVVEALCTFDDGTVVRRLSGRGGRREPLGFGLGEVVLWVTPIVWLVLDAVAKRAADSAVEGAARGTKAILRKVFRRGVEPVEFPRLTEEQLAWVERESLEAARNDGLPEDRAQAIVDALVRRLAVRKPDPEPDDEARDEGQE